MQRHEYYTDKIFFAVYKNNFTPKNISNEHQKIVKYKIPITFIHQLEI